jgi:hypothetical protein
MVPGLFRWFSLGEDDQVAVFARTGGSAVFSRQAFQVAALHAAGIMFFDCRPLFLEQFSIFCCNLLWCSWLVRGVPRLRDAGADHITDNVVRIGVDALNCELRQYTFVHASSASERVFKLNDEQRDVET